MTKKPTKASEDAAEAENRAVEAEIDAAAATGPESEVGPLEAQPEPLEADDEGGVEAEEVEPGAPNAASDEAAGGDPIDGSADPVDDSADPVVPDADADAEDPQPDAEPTAEQLGGVAQLITDMLAWHRAELVARLADEQGLKVDGSIEGVRVTMAGITAESPIIGPTGLHQALENWGNAARRRILELEAAG